MLAEDPQWQRTWSLFFSVWVVVYEQQQLLLWKFEWIYIVRRFMSKGEKKVFFCRFLLLLPSISGQPTTAAAAQQWKKFFIFPVFLLTLKAQALFLCRQYLQQRTQTNERWTRLENVNLFGKSLPMVDSNSCTHLYYVQLWSIKCRKITLISYWDLALY